METMIYTPSVALGICFDVLQGEWSFSHATSSPNVSMGAILVFKSAITDFRDSLVISLISCIAFVAAIALCLD